MNWRNKAMAGAYRKGRTAARVGIKRTSCPYMDLRGPSGHVTFSRAFMRAWREGWDYEDRDRENGVFTL